MKDKLSLFNYKDGRVSINKECVLAYDVFKTILRRDRGSTGDAQGKEKQRAWQEFAYIYHVADAESLPNRKGFTEEDAKIYAIKEAGLPDKWEEDDLVRRAINIYRENNGSLPKNIVSSLLRVLRNANKNIDIINDEINRIQSLPRKSPDDIALLLDYSSKLIKLSVELPEKIKQLQVVIKTIEDEETSSSTEKMRGSKEVIPSSADPNRRY